MRFLVTLRPPVPLKEDATQNTVTVTYSTRDLTESYTDLRGSVFRPATQGDDYTGVSGETITFTSGQGSPYVNATTTVRLPGFQGHSGTRGYAMQKYIDIDIVDDDIEDSGERFEVLITGVDNGAVIVDGSAYGTIYNDETEVHGNTLEAKFSGTPPVHDGSTFGATLKFSLPVHIESEGLKAAIGIEGGTITSATKSAAHGSREWALSIEPGSATEDVELSLGTTTDCGAENAVCTHGGVMLTQGAQAVIGASTGVTITKTTVEADESGDGRWMANEPVVVKLRFSEPVNVKRGTPTVDILSDLLPLAMMVRYQSGSGSDELTFEFQGSNSEYGTPSLIENSLMLNGARIESVATGEPAELGHPAATPQAQEPEPEVPEGMTAQFRNMPTNHDGAEFSFLLELSEPFGGSYRTLRDDAFEVDGGYVMKAQRAGEGASDHNRVWRISVMPEGEGAVEIRLPATEDCEEEGAICSSDGERMAAAVSATVSGEDPSETTAAFTAAFADVPASHSGEPFSFKLNFSEVFKIGYRVIRDQAFELSGGTVTAVKRLDNPHHEADGLEANARWRITVAPTGRESVTVTLPATEDCHASGAVCTEGGKKLTNTTSATVSAAAGISVADANVDEGSGDTLDFVVTLEPAAGEEVRVDYATTDGSAKAGSDFEAVSGTLVFAAGETTKTVAVNVVDDAHDEGEETLTLRLSNANGADARIEGATATGTITNSDPMPREWLARFGRTVAFQISDEIKRRWARSGSSHVTLGGHKLGAWEGDGGEEEERFAQATTAWAGGGRTPQSLNAREILLGSAFHLSETSEGPAFNAWGSFAFDGFEAEIDGVRMSGDVTTGMLGADVDTGTAMAGASIAWTEGDGEYNLSEDGDRGDVETSMTSVFPYLLVRARDDLDIWGMAGYGKGSLNLTQWSKGGAARDHRYKTGISMKTAAIGARREIVPSTGKGLSVAIDADALWVRTESEEARTRAGNLAAGKADVTRLRVGVDAKHELDISGGRLVPQLGVALRHDGGDAETGTGLEARGSIAYQRSRFSLEGAVRSLLIHEEADYKEWGVSGTVHLSPGAYGRGLSLRFAPRWGNAGDGAEVVWGRTPSGTEGAWNAHDQGIGLDTEVGYGIGAGERRGLITPFVGATFGDGAPRQWRAGARWQIGANAQVSVESTNSWSAGEEGEEERSVMLRGLVRW